MASDNPNLQDYSPPPSPSRARASPSSPVNGGEKIHVKCVVIGAGWTGISVAAALRSYGVHSFVVLESGQGVANFWEANYDRIRLHTPWHGLPCDQGLALYGYPMFKPKRDIINYLTDYHKLHNLEPHMRFAERVVRVARDAPGSWIVETAADWGSREYRCDFVAVCTSKLRVPFIPAIPNRNVFEGRILHSREYRTGHAFRNKNVLVVGSGNSAAEICADLVECNAKDVTMLVHGPRLFIPLPRLAWQAWKGRICGMLGEVSAYKDWLLQFGTEEYWSAVKRKDAGMASLAVDMSQHGISKPGLGFSEANIKYGRIGTFDQGAIEMIARGRVAVRKAKLIGFTEREACLSDGSKLAAEAQVVFSICVVARCRSSGSKNSPFHCIGGMPGGDAGDELFYDADDGQSDAIPMKSRRCTDFPEYEPIESLGRKYTDFPEYDSIESMGRKYTDFPEYEPIESMGPWRTTEVERRPSFTSGSSSWLLVGRRHSVDDRRDALEQGKALFLHSLAAKADGLWRKTTAARAEQMQHAEEQADKKLTTQALALKVASEFWAERHTSDKAYLERLEASGNSSSGVLALPPQQAQAEAEWRLNMQRKAEYSGAWARELPELMENHEKSAAEIRRAIVRAISDAEGASKLVRDARASVWPAKPVRAPTKFLGSQGADFGPGPCLWLAVRRYLMACGALHRAQSTALARVKREEERLNFLGSWVDKKLGHGDGGSHTFGGSSTVSSAPEVSPVRSHGGSVSSHSFGGSSTISSVPEVSPERAHKAERDAEQDSGSDEERHEEVLDISMDVSALVVFEQDCEVRRTSDQSWASSHLLFSVDLWLHIWTPADNYRTTTPTDSMSLTGTCLRPVAKRCKEEPRILQLRFRPPAAPGVVESIGCMLWGKDDDQQRELWIRCADDDEADELLASLELVEKLYPIVA